MTPSTSELIASRYRLLAGRPYSTGLLPARDEWLDRRVAVTRAPRNLWRQSQSLLDLCTLDHPNLARVLDFAVESEEHLLVVVAPLSGDDLPSWVARGQRLSHRAALAAAGVLRALRRLHQHGYGACGLSPRAIRVGPGRIGRLPAVRVIPAALWQHCAPDELDDLPYRPPEVLDGQQEPASDIYSLGAILLEALTGQAPRPPLLPQRLRGDALLELVVEMVQPLPEHRPNAAELLEALSDFVDLPLQVSRDELAGAYFPSSVHSPSWSTLDELVAQVLTNVESGASRAFRVRGVARRELVDRACLQARFRGFSTSVVRSRDTLRRILDVLEAAPITVPRLVCLDMDDPCAVPWRELNQLLERVGRAPGLGLLWRGAIEPIAEVEGGWETVQVPAPSPAEVRGLVGTLLLAPIEKPCPWLDQVHGAAAEPRQVVELVRAQVEAGLPDGLVVPTEPAALAAHRVARLEDDQRALLATIAVAPTPVPKPVIDRVAPGYEQHLDCLLDRGLVLATERGLTTTTVVARAAAQEIFGAALINTHEAYAEAWSALDEEAHAGVVGHHLVRAGKLARGARMLLEDETSRLDDLRLAGLQLPLEDRQAEALVAALARRLGAASLEPALELADRLERHRPDQGLPLRAELLLDAGKPQQALRVLDVVGEETAQTRLIRARALVLLGEYQRAVSEVHSARAAESDDAVGIQLRNVLGLCWSFLGQNEEAIELLAAAEQQARQIMRPGLLARVLNSQAIVWQRLERVDLARRCYQECVELFRSAGDDRLAATVTVNLGTLAQGEMKLAEALHHYRAAQGPDLTSAWALANEANLLLTFGDVQAARPRLQRAHQLACKVGGRSLLGHVLLYQAEACCAEGRLERAQDLVAQARGQFADDDSPGQRAADRLTVQLELLTGDVEQARQAMHRLRAQSEQPPVERLRSRLLAAKVALAGLAAARAQDVIDELRRALSEAPDHPALTLYSWELHALLCDALARQGLEQPAREEAERLERSLAELRESIPPAFRSLFDRRWDICLARRRVRRSLDRGDGPPPESLMRLLALARELGESTSAEELYRKTVDAAIELCGAGRAYLLVRGPSLELEIAASRAAAGGVVRDAASRVDRSLAAAALEEGGPKSADAALCLPLGDRPFSAALYVELGVGGLDPSTTALVSALADQVSVALAATRRLGRLAREHEVLARAKAETEQENRRLAARIAAQTEQLDDLDSRVRSYEQELERRFQTTALVGRSAEKRALLSRLDRAADLGLPLLILGEPGTGKADVAQVVHRMGRAGKPFVSMRCGVIPHGLQEAELLGYVAGALAGVTRGRAGCLELAEDGTVLLEEVDRLAPPLRARLVSTLERGICRLGEQTPRPLGCRVVATSTEESLGPELDDLFRTRVRVPPLRRRVEDIPLLVGRIVAGKRRVTQSALAALAEHDWRRGNLRELEQELQQSMARSVDDDVLDLHHLSERVRGPLAAAQTGRTFYDAMRDHERRIIEQALTEAEHNVTLAARRLDISRVVLHRKMRALGVTRAAARRGALAPQGAPA
jgi:DNA-binding NtrC family response regulator